jgi:hypothetical protein
MIPFRDVNGKGHEFAGRRCVCVWGGGGSSASRRWVVETVMLHPLSVIEHYRVQVSQNKSRMKPLPVSHKTFLMWEFLLNDPPHFVQCVNLTAPLFIFGSWFLQTVELFIYATGT